MYYIILYYTITTILCYTRIKLHLAALVKKVAVKGKSKAQYKAKRRQMRFAMRAALRQWRAEQREFLTSYSRKQLLKALVPEAGHSKKKVEKLEEGAGKKKVKALRGHLT